VITLSNVNQFSQFLHR